MVGFYWRFGLAFLVVTITSFEAQGQDVIGKLPSLPSGFYEAAASRISEDKGLGVFEGSLSIRSLYDSNVTQGSSRGVRPRESDFVIEPTLRASYRIGNSRWYLGAESELSRLTYTDADEFNSTNYSLGFYGGYQSKILVASFKTSFTSQGGINRRAGEFLEQEVFKGGLLASYRFSPKTSLLASWDHNITQNQTGGFSDTSSSTFGLSAVWRATPLLNIGPGFRYGVRVGVDDEEFIVFGPTLRLDYQLSTKVKLRSSIGLDFSDSPFGVNDELWNWSISLNYKASELWGFLLTMKRDTRASLSRDGGFDQTSAIRLNYWRKMRRARLGLGVAYEDREPQGALLGGVTGIRDSSFLKYSASLSMPIYKDDVDLSFNLAWLDQSADDDSFSWDGFQAGVGLSWSF